MSNSRSVLGLILIILGVILLGFVLARFIIYILFTLLGLYLINYGLKLRGMPSAWYYARTWWIHIDRYRRYR